MAIDVEAESKIKKKKKKKEEKKITKYRFIHFEYRHHDALTVLLLAFS